MVAKKRSARPEINSMNDPSVMTFFTPGKPEADEKPAPKPPTKKGKGKT